MEYYTTVKVRLNFKNISQKKKEKYMKDGYSRMQFI